MCYIANRWYFKTVFRIKDLKPAPNFKFGQHVKFENQVKMYNLKIGKNDADIHYIICVINYLRFLKDVSTPRFVTSDKKFKKIIKRAGYSVIDPERVTINTVKQLLKKAPTT